MYLSACLATTSLDFVLAILVLAAALVALAYPLYRARTPGVLVNASTLDDLLAQRDGVYATLRDLELDQQLGKLDSADYTALREKYMTRATEILQELDELRGKGDAQAASAEIEKQVTALRGQRMNDERYESAPPSAVVVDSSELRCANCGRPYHAGDQFCARCGRALS